MGSMAAIISGLEYSRSELLKSIEGLSHRELTKTPLYDDWTIKDVLAHVVGWDQRVVRTLPLMLQNRADEIPGVEVEQHNRKSVEAWRDRSLAEVLAEIKSTHQQIIDILSSIDHVEIDMRRERNGQVITIRSYVIDIMIEHERRHAAEIREWRKSLDQRFEPDAIKKMLEQNRARFLSLLDQFEEEDVLAEGAVGAWSIKDLVGHVADWEQRMLKAGRHIYDRSEPPVLPVGDPAADWNGIMAARRAGKTWPENHHDLLEIQRATQDFVARLKPGDWRLRGPYPWPDDQGTLAELIFEIADHYADHIPDLERLLERRQPKSQPKAKPWIRWRLDHEATGLLKKEYKSALERAGMIWNIVRIMSLKPKALQASMRLYGAVVHDSSELLGRPEREMIAVVVSQTNDCHY